MKTKNGETRNTVGAVQTYNLETAWSHQLETNLDVNMLGFPILAYDSVESTSDILKSLAEDGAPEGLTVVARTQTKGRGQLGRSWDSPGGQGVYMSVMIKPELPGSEVKWLGVYSAVATARALMALGLQQVNLKWPNDILVRQRKLAGVLVEPRLGNDKIHFAIIGIGINVRQGPDDWPVELKDVATSCHMEGVPLDCDRVITRVLQDLDTYYRRIKSEGTGFLIEEWSRCGGTPSEI